MLNQNHLPFYLFHQCVNFINILCTNFLYKRCFGSFFSSYMYVTCTWKKLPKQCSFKKRARIKLMKLTPWRYFVLLHSSVTKPQYPLESNTGILLNCKLIDKKKKKLFSSFSSCCCSCCCRCCCCCCCCCVKCQNKFTCTSRRRKWEWEEEEIEFEE